MAVSAVAGVESSNFNRISTESYQLDRLHTGEKLRLINKYFHIFHKKSKVVPVLFNGALRQEGVLGSGGIAPRILDLVNRWMFVVSFMPQPLYPQRNGPWYPLDRRLGGPQSRSGRSGEEKNSQPLRGTRTPDH
jgi:hypothetical protein